MTMRITRCSNIECGYESLSHGIDECKYCGSKLEILASTDKKEVEEE